jgi:polyribonucleotide nucleotidyltransferase
MKAALDQAEGGRLHILGEMSRALTGAHAELGEHAPRIEQIKIPTDKIHDMIGTGGNNYAVAMVVLPSCKAQERQGLC